MTNTPETLNILNPDFRMPEHCGGDRWSILHGDSLQILRQFEPNSFDAIITDPPYASGGSSQTTKNRSTNEKYSSMSKEKALPDFDSDQMDQLSWMFWTAAWLQDARRIAKPGAPVCLFIDWRQLPAMTLALQWAGWTWRGVAVWDKVASRPQKGRFRQQSEYIVWGSNGKMPLERNVGCLPGVFRYPNPQNRIHVTEKPLQLKLRSLQAELAQKQTEYARLTKPVAADSYDLEKAQQALQAAYQAAENSAAAWAEKQANAGSERDALQRELNERQEKAAQYAREIAEKQAQRELLQQEESPDEEIISRIEAELTQLTAEETQNREALAEAEARLNEADAALESVQSQREEAARTAAQAAEQAEQARNDARHAYEKSVEAASETAAANAASATVLAEQIREMESSVETLKKLDEQEGVFCAPQTGTVESLQLMQGQTSGQVGGSISDPERGYQIRFALEAEDAVQDTAGVTVTVMQGAKSESVKINSSVSQQDGGVVLSAALTGSDWQVGKAELTIRLSETEYDCCLPVSALHSDNGGDFVYSVEERNTILGLQNIVRKVYVEVVERNNELAALRNYTTGAPVVAATTKSLQEGARVRTAG